ncbi:lantibiotic dehydratase [Myroides odoratus]|uniref:Lantibiotic dehydratase n=1 Tax=Myroides odoratus TaxID=256 RepID=A0A9Q7EA65_MYROD|nr:lantibiotic dehydratase [Myroides odoratus]EHQ41400.1 Lantibiotic dehydratase domain protein [Myroides odoratus DSM 2801]EKB08729.1 thiopeptide-type bacteriocin biosynthesis domain-containing protein [Myroides odoratus CIP 103059]QQT98834.1 lantibiotic dehydratase [Myroides odoratus]WQD58982.1 lantibiotic dehydratase [Myroides odoratus]STZ32439.1 thiopeptide-type bacteriocin biosynthesis domain [Myroides odoratus]
MDLNFYSTTIIREPIFEVSRLRKIPNNHTDLAYFIQDLRYDTIFCSALYLAAPDLYQEWLKCSSTPKDNIKDSRINKSILKYYIRSCSNPIPFGLFATYSQIDNRLKPTNKKSNSEYFCFADLDTSYFRKVIHAITKNYSLNSILKYRFNNSIFKIGNSFRYIEYQDTPEKVSRNYTLGLIEENEVFNRLLSVFTAEHALSEIVEYLLHNIENISKEEITNYLHDLISNKILVCSLDLNLNTSPILYLESVFEKEKQNFLTNTPLYDMYQRIIKVRNLLNGMEFNEIKKDGVSYLQKIENQIKSILKIEHNRSVLLINLKKNAFQQMPHNYDEPRLLKALDIYQSFTLSNYERKLQSDKNLEVFCKDFINRYGDAIELPLLEVLDNDTGIGYLKGRKEESGFSPLLDDFEMPAWQVKSESITVNDEIDRFWTTNIINAIRTKQSSIDLSTLELPECPNFSNNLGGTFPIIYSKYDDMLFDIRAGAHSALHYIARFTFIDNDLAQFTNEIVNDESLAFQDCLTAEIFHHASNNSGNVTLRKIKRPYEISILTNPTGDSQPISLSDIYIKIVDNKVVLTSKKFQKEIIPFLSSAQNFHFDSLSIYQLVCDLQAQYRHNYFTLDLNPFLLNNFQFIPRICYGSNIILSTATWKIWKSELTSNTESSKTIHLNEFEKIKKSRSIPRFVFFMDNNEAKFIFDLENTIQLEILFDLIKHSDYFILKECLYSPHKKSVVFVNENIKSILVKNKQITSSPFNHYFQYDPKIVKQKFLPANKWLYYKFYTGINFSDRFILEELYTIILHLSEKKLISQWFFVRYADPDYHIRVRFLISDLTQINHVIQLISTNIKALVDQRLLWRTEISTYEREIERYGEDIHISEHVFYLSSNLVLKGLQHSGTDQFLWLSAMWETDLMLRAFNLTLEERAIFVHQQFVAFCKEFKLGKIEISKASQKFKQNEKEIEQHFQLRTQEFFHCNNQMENVLHETIKKLCKNKNKDEILYLASSHIHMHINRYFKTKPRLHELILYGLLEKKYRKKIALERNKS